MISPDAWRPADDLSLEPNALRAVCATENVVVTAGPGAGKTEMLAQRADYLLRTAECRFPRRILAISFKVDAASNLRRRVLDRCGPELAQRLDSYTFHGFAKRIIDRFRPVLTGVDALDPDYAIGAERIQFRQISFADMVPLAIQVLETSAFARNAVRNTYSHVFLDEFQDCTNLQYRLVRVAFGETDACLTAVGDTKQRIMGWAGALEGIFEEFGADFDASPLNLYQNFRSAPVLLRMQNAMVREMDPPAAVPDDQIVGDGGDLQVERYQSSDHEAADISERIATWIRNDGIVPSEIAVLISREPDYFGAALMRQLAARAIPYRNEQQLQDLFAEPAAQLVIDLLTVVVHDRQPETFNRLMWVLLEGATDEESEYRERSRWDRFIDSARQEVRVLGSEEWARSEAMNFVDDFIDLVGTEQLSALSPDYESGSRLQEVLAQTRERLAEAVSETGSVASALEQLTVEGAVRILTVHKSKGLEFHSVVVLGIEVETFWGDHDSERSAFFVAISRAKERLILTTADERPKPDGYPRRWKTPRTPLVDFLKFAR